MKKFLYSLVLVCGTLAQGAKSEVLLNESFSYPDGPLSTGTFDAGNPVAGWTTHSGTAGQIQVAGGAISITTSNSEDVNRLLGTTITSGSVFGGFDFSVSAAAPAGGGDYEYFAHFGNGSADFTARMDITAATGAGDFGVGIAGAGGAADSVWASDLLFNNTYRAVIGYNRDTGISSLWIDPTSEASVSILSLADTNDVTAFFFRESTSSVGETILIDNLIVATTFNEALGVTAVPEPSSVAVLALAGIGGVVARRRRKSKVDSDATAA